MAFDLRPIVPRKPFVVTERFISTMAAEMDLFGRQLRVAMQKYPPQIVGLRHGPMTPKQRRYFFWALRNGRIKVPYRRTKTLGRSWSNVTIISRGAIIARVGSNAHIAPYNRWVQGPPGVQAPAMARRGWQSINPTALLTWSRFKPRLRNAFRRALRAA